MKVFVVLIVLAAVAFVRPDDDHYDSKYDDFDTQRLIHNPHLLKAYALCLLNEANCDSDGDVSKKVIHEVLATNCGRCTLKQRHVVRALATALQKQVPNLWKKLVQQYDPEDKYKEFFDKFLTGSD